MPEAAATSTQTSEPGGLSPRYACRTRRAHYCRTALTRDAHINPISPQTSEPWGLSPRYARRRFRDTHRKTVRITSENFAVGNRSQRSRLIRHVTNGGGDRVIVVQIPIAAVSGPPAPRTTGVQTERSLAHPLKRAAHLACVVRAIAHDQMNMIGKDCTAQNAPGPLPCGIAECCHNHKGLPLGQTHRRLPLLEARHFC